MKIYKTREAIIKDIDAAHRKIVKAKKVAQEHLDAEELLAGTDNASELRECRDAADKQFRKIKRLETVRLPKLGEKLAEFDTIPLIQDSPSPKDFVLAHQYLYYVKSSPIWGDFEYDKYCEKHGIPSNGGSDADWSYDEEIKALASDMIKNPNKYPVPRFVYTT